MGNTQDAMISTLLKINGYRPYFKQAFGSEEITKERVAMAIADYERTRMSGNSPWDKWKKNKDEAAVSAEVKQGEQITQGAAAPNNEPRRWSAGEASAAGVAPRSRRC